ASVPGRLARVVAAPSRRASAPDGRRRRAYDRHAPKLAVCRRSYAARALGDLRRVRSAANGQQMTRDQLEHIIRASGTIADVADIIVIGSQAVLGQFPHVP